MIHVRGEKKYAHCKKVEIKKKTAKESKAL